MSNGDRRRTALLHDHMFPQTIRQGTQTPRHPGQTVIAHISDLHFTSDTDFNSSPWNALLADFESWNGKKVDVLVVTGDLVDSPFTGFVGIKDEATASFSKVDAYLKALCKALDIDPETSLVVVPGNHDYRLSGIIRKKNQPLKFCKLLGQYCRPLLLPELRLCLLCIDSNFMQRRLDLAAGAVERNDLVDFGTLTRRVANGYSDCTKVVLLHHHPMPIAAAETSSVFDDSRFTLLKNAGQFMTNMVRAGVKLVLHGHQHSPGYSKAIFPYERSKEHMITVVAAGSAGRGTQNYNLITISNGGKIDLERRSLRDRTVYDHEQNSLLLSYDDARRLDFDGLAAANGAKFKARKFTRLYVIKSGSGDADQHERYEGVEAFSDDVDKFATSVESISGFFARPTYTPRSPENQQINWVWGGSAYTSARREASVVFAPPLRKNHSITFESERKAYNLFHFNQRDREDATNGKWKQEFIEVLIQNAFDLFVLTVCFPRDHWPGNFYRLAHDRRKCPLNEHTFRTCAAHDLESQRFDAHFSKFSEARTIVLSIEKPIPGFTYWIYWNLPEEEESELRPFEAGAARDFERQLLLMRDRTGPQHAAGQQWFDNLRTDITKATVWRTLSGADDMEVSLYVYDREKRGLVCVAASRQGHAVPDEPWDSVILPGTTIVGASYRRKEPMLYCPAVRSPLLGESEYVMRIPEDWRAIQKGKYTVVCVVPLFFPIPDGRRVAVLAFASKSDLSRLLHFVPRWNVGIKEEKVQELEKKRDSLLEEVMVGQCQKLANALAGTVRH